MLERFYFQLQEYSTRRQAEPAATLRSGLNPRAYLNNIESMPINRKIYKDSVRAVIGPVYSLSYGTTLKMVLHHS